MHGGGGGHESKYSMVHRSTPSTGLPESMPRASGRSQEGPEHHCRMGCVGSWVAELTLVGHACTSQPVL